MYRPKSNAVWFNLPGVVAAYQPVRAPNAKLARINVANEQRTPGRYAAAPGVAPGWSPLAGWYSDGTKWLSIGITGLVLPGLSILGRFSGYADVPSTTSLAGSITSGAKVLRFSPNFDSRFNRRAYRNAAGDFAVSGKTSAGVIGLAGSAAYLNGASDGTITTGTGVLDTPLYLMAEYNAGAASSIATTYLQAFLLAERVLSNAEVVLASRQMAYCHVNPDWSAWGSRRRYYYVPSAAAGLAFSPIGSGVVGSSVVRRVV